MGEEAEGEGENLKQTPNPAEHGAPHDLTTLRSRPAPKPRVGHFADSATQAPLGFPYKHLRGFSHEAGHTTQGRRQPGQDSVPILNVGKSVLPSHTYTDLRSFVAKEKQLPRAFG